MAYDYVKAVLRALNAAGFRKINAFAVGAGGAALPNGRPGYVQVIDASVFVGALVGHAPAMNYVSSQRKSPDDTVSDHRTGAVAEYVAVVGTRWAKEKGSGPDISDLDEDIEFHGDNSRTGSNSSQPMDIDTGPMMYDGPIKTAVVHEGRSKRVRK